MITVWFVLSVLPWPYSLNWQNLFSESEMAKTLYSSEFPLVDLTVMPDNQILQHQRIAMLERLQKTYTPTGAKRAPVQGSTDDHC